MKQTSKKFFFALGIIFLVYQSYKTLSIIHEFDSDSWGLITFMGWLINMFITGIFAFSVFGFPAERLLPKSYYLIKQPKKLKRIYKKLKVELFRKFLLATLWKSPKQRDKYFNGKVDGIENLEIQSMKSEFGHLIPLIIIIFVSIYLLAIGQWKLAIPTMIFNILGNLYPVILQRHHRMRIQILRKRYFSKINQK